MKPVFLYFLMWTAQCFRVAVRKQVKTNCSDQFPIWPLGNCQQTNALKLDRSLQSSIHSILPTFPQNLFLKIQLETKGIRSMCYAFFTHNYSTTEDLVITSPELSLPRSPDPGFFCPCPRPPWLTSLTAGAQHLRGAGSPVQKPFQHGAQLPGLGVHFLDTYTHTLLPKALQSLLKGIGAQKFFLIGNWNVSPSNSHSHFNSVPWA